jgi:hypothetical protein
VQVYGGSFQDAEGNPIASGDQTGLLYQVEC